MLRRRHRLVLVHERGLRDAGFHRELLRRRVLGRGRRVRRLASLSERNDLRRRLLPCVRRVRTAMLQRRHVLRLHLPRRRPLSLTGPFDLERFVRAQNPVIDRVTKELRAGAKRSHWMWFVFPQIAGLGSSSMAERYAIANLDEARAYLAHPVLGKRLRECTEIVLGVEGRSAHDIFGWPDDMKFRSSMTLFARAADDPATFAAALAKYFDGKEDEATLARI